MDFKSKAFTRTYGLLASTYTYAAWEKLSVFLRFQVPKPPLPKKEDLFRDILEAIDMESHWVEKKAR